jgi:ABC-2 type transport system ATP-binding protein
LNGGPPPVVLEEVTRRFGGVAAVEGLTLAVRRSEMFGLIGPDGAGKTTCLRLVLGLLRPHAGRAVTCGLDPVRQRRALSGKVGYLSQRFSLYGDLTVDENIAFFADIHGVAGWKARRDELLELVRLTPFRSRLADRLSGGMKQKLALACTLIHTPELLVLDEPTTGVDPVSRRDFWKLLAGLQQGGMTVLLTTPYLDEAERCQRVGLIDRGRLLTVDAPDALRARSPEAMVELIARPKRGAAKILRERPGVTDVEVFGERLHVTLAGDAVSRAPGAAEALAADLRDGGFEVDAARLVTPSLEDLFIAWVRKAESARTPGT